MPNVSLFDYTGAGTNDPAKYAAAVLLFTKNTRLKMSADGFTRFLAMSHADQLKELEYMANTVPSSWEFIEYKFIITGVTRAFTHQLVRTRTASYAQQAMRVLNVSEGAGWEYATGPSIMGNAEMQTVYDGTMDLIDAGYKALIAHGAKVEDARGLLPTNILTNICVSINMRSLVDLIHKRTGPRVQDEYREVATQMKRAAIGVHPFLTLFLERNVDRALQDLEEKITKHMPEEERISTLKLIDQLKTRL